MPKRDRHLIALECSDCHERNYMTNKNPRTNTERLVLNKYCKFERKITVHKETK